VFAAIQYLPTETVKAVLRILSTRFPNSTVRYLATCQAVRKPACSSTTATTRATCSNTSLKWASGGRQREIGCLASSYGWEVSFSRMSDDIFNAKYRFDAILTRRVNS